MTNPRIRYGGIALAILAVEVVIATRFVHINFVRGSLGDVLVVVFLYALALSFREFDRVRLAAGTFLFSCFIEVLQYFQLAQVLGLRHGGVAWVVLGSTATWEDVLCYLAGAAVALAADLAAFGRPAGTPRYGSSGSAT